MFHKDNAMTYSPVAPNSSLNSASIGHLDRSSTFPATPERALEIITSPERPATISLIDWSRMSSVDKFRAAQGIAEPLVQLARAEVVGGRVNIIPETDRRSDLPSFNIPNNVGAQGFSPGIWTHDYLVRNFAPPSLVGKDALVAIGAALRGNPTPGNDAPATGRGTRNDVGNLMPFDGDDNYVRSYVIASADPSRSDAIVNYTITGEHALSEGFVMRFAEMLPTGEILLVTYGEGNAGVQSEATSSIWREAVTEAWTQNANEIFSSAKEALYK
jgi:hypothetical protein